MRALILGGGGFLGQKLAHALAQSGTLRGTAITRLTLADLAPPPAPRAGFAIESAAIDITQRDAVEALVARTRPHVIWHLAAIVSGQAEEEFDLGVAVNLMGALHVFEAGRTLGTCPVVVFTSSIAVYGGPVPEPIGDWTLLNPQTSYGAQKAAAELLLTDYSRKGFVDGRGLRLPTISIRPGAPNRAASSFMSSMFREPLQGQEAVCPVGPDYAHWYLSPRRCVDNLIHGAEVDGAALGTNRCYGLPGRRYTIEEMVEAMREVAGEAPLRLIRWEPQPEIARIVNGWKANFAPEKLLALGFVRDESFHDNLRFFLEDDIERPEP